MPTGIKIKEIRQQKGLTQKQLGDMCGIADANIRKYENGKQNPKIETLQKIADALKVSVYDLFCDDCMNYSNALDILAEVSEDKPVAYPGLERKISEIGYSIIYGTVENSDGIDLVPGDVVIVYPDGDKLYITPGELGLLNDEVDSYIKFRLEELRKQKKGINLM